MLAGLIQSVIAISSAHYAFSSKPTLRQPLKNASGGKEKSSFFEIAQEIEVSSSRAVTTRKYENYYIISTFEAAVSRGHKHGCLVKLIDSSFFEIAQEIEVSSSRAVTTRKYENYYIISTFEAAVSRGHKHGCLVKLIDSFSVITASYNASLRKARLEQSSVRFDRNLSLFLTAAVFFSSLLVRLGSLLSLLLQFSSILWAGTWIKTRCRPAEYDFSVQGI